MLLKHLLFTVFYGDAFCATGWCVDYCYKRLCLINYSVRTETELFRLYLYAIVFISIQPTLWIATGVYPIHRENAHLKKSHAPRPTICAGPWELCHLQVLTIFWPVLKCTFNKPHESDSRRSLFCFRRIQTFWHSHEILFSTGRVCGELCQFGVFQNCFSDHMLQIQPLQHPAGPW